LHCWNNFFWGAIPQKRFNPQNIIEEERKCANERMIKANAVKEQGLSYGYAERFIRQ
jgi:hypothetical protein